MILWALKALGWAKFALRAAISALTRWPWQIACLCLLAASVWLWQGRQAERVGRAADRVAYAKAQDDATMRALAAKAETERKYERDAHAAEVTEANLRLAVRDAAARHIVANRVRAEVPSGPPIGTSTAAQDRSAGLPPPVSTSAFVAITDSDVLACSDTYAYAIAAREWALSILQDGHD